ncbi:MAG: DUF2971 domain-containing protein [Hyphomonadaceae bacterium]|nr:DUF2971 domain-containing protein [Hyphomonadaceae bacterium]
MGITDWSPEIVHYTSLDKFASILNSNELWFGNLTDLNDTQECDHFLDIVIPEFPSLIQGGAAFAGVLPIVREMVRTQTYVSSWCEYLPDRPDGKLSMWRAYANDGEGVGIVADSASFLPSAIKPANLGFHVSSSRVNYVRKEDVVAHAKDVIERLSRVHMFPVPVPEALAAAAIVAVKAVCVKHDGWFEEEEIRFLHFGGVPGLGKPEALRQSGPRQFFALGLQQYPEAQFDFRPARILKKVVVGPKGDKAARAREVRRLLDAHGLGHVQIAISDIPYR